MMTEALQSAGSQATEDRAGQLEKAGDWQGALRFWRDAADAASDDFRPSFEGAACAARARMPSEGLYFLGRLPPDLLARRALQQITHQLIRQARDEQPDDWRLDRLATQCADMSFEAFLAAAGVSIWGKVSQQNCRTLLRFFEAENSRFRVPVGRRLANLCWQIDGPGQALSILLKTLRDEAESDQQVQDELSIDLIASLVAIGEIEAAGAEIENRPHLASAYSVSLPIALVASEALNVAVETRTAAKRFADLYRTLRSSTVELDQVLGTASSVAVVGNSPCELGLGKGRLIDEHDHVIRFNRYSVAENYVADYGQKTSFVAGNMDRARDLVAPERRIIVNGNDVLHRAQGWQTIMRRVVSGDRFYILPAHLHRSLVWKLQASPSCGMTVLGYLRRLRGPFQSMDTFGFAFTDQIGADAGPAHYFDNGVPSMSHDWVEEKKLFDELKSPGRFL